jgi:hypothetical protein
VIAHLLDIEARGARFRAANPQIPTVNVRLEEFESRAGVDRLFGLLGLTPTDATAAIVGGGPINHNVRKKAKRGLTISPDECRRRIERYLERAARLGIDPPSGLVLD